MVEKVKTAISQFQIEGDVTDAIPYGQGHINDTYLVSTASNGETHKYIYQRINTSIFHNVDELMKNIFKVTDYIREKSEAQNIERATLHFIRTNDDKMYLQNEDGAFRVYTYIDNVECLQKVENPLHFYLSGVGFGKFQKYLDGFPAEDLFEVIKNFHNTADRMRQFREAIAADKAGKLKNVKREVDFFLDRESYCNRILDLIASGDIPVRVTHNDTKLNNVLIDTVLNQPIAVIDLDTIMPGSIVYDFGDSIRFGANIGAEDETDLTKVGFSEEFFEAYAKGFLGEVGDKLTEAERDNLAFGAILMTYECGMRFLTDHLNGDVYFKVHHDGHN
ncbi:MAG: phosphotransferase, partial [Clostridia bacterium]